VLTLIVWPQDAAATPVSAKADIERIPLFMLTIPSDFELPVRLPSRQRVTASKSTARGGRCHFLVRVSVISQNSLGETSGPKPAL
jgi:hypothetical protein